MVRAVVKERPKWYWSFLGGSVVKNLPSRRHKFNTWVRMIPGEENGNTLQYSCLGNPIDREAWRTTVHGIAKESDRA